MLAACMALIDEQTDREKFEHLYYTYKDMMFKLSMSILHNEALAHEAVQDCFFRIAEMISEISVVESKKTKALIVIMVKNRSRYNLRSEHYEIKEQLDDNEISDNTFDQILSELGYRKLVDIINSLNDTYREVLVLRLIEEMSVDEIAKTLNIPYRTVETRLSRGRKILKEKMEEEYDKCSF